MPLVLSYKSVPSGVRFETDASGNLRITIPRRGLTALGIRPIHWVFAVAFPIGLMFCIWLIYPGSESYKLGLLASLVMSFFAIVGGCFDSLRFPNIAWIDATPQQFTIYQQRFARLSIRTYSRNRIQAIDVKCPQSYRSRGPWHLSVYGPYEWDYVLCAVYRRDLEDIAERLRILLEPPPSRPNPSLHNH